MKNNHAVIICVESVFIEDPIVAFVSSKAFSRQQSGTKHNSIPNGSYKEDNVKEGRIYPLPQLRRSDPWHCFS